MTTPICEQYGIDFPLFAFSHCRDVVAAVTNAGGMGVLGGTAFTPEALEQELAWIDEQVRGKPYGVDIIVPAKFEGKGEKLAAGALVDRIPAEYREYVTESLPPTTFPTTTSGASAAAACPVTPARHCWKWHCGIRSS